MNYEWSSIIKKNTTGNKYHSDCQVVTAMNAYYVLTGQMIPQYTEPYYQLCELVGAVHGSAISIRWMHSLLGMSTEEECDTLPDLEGLGTEYVLEATVWHEKCGFHSVAIIDAKKNKLRVPNFRWVTSRVGWIDKTEFLTYLKTTNRGWTIRKLKLSERE